MSATPSHPKEGFDAAELWLLDSLRVLRPSAAVYQITVDMTRALEGLNALRRAGTIATPTHLLVRASARALAANPALHQLIAGATRVRPQRVDIGISITGETFVAPVLVIEGADQKSVAEIASEAARRVPEIQREERERLASMRRWGRLVPFAVLRRLIMRWLFGQVSFRQKTAGTFQVSTVPVDWAATSVFVATGVLVGGQVRSRVVALEDRPVVRPTMTLTLSGDHAVWDGRAAARLLSAVKMELEQIVSPSAPLAP